MTVTFPASRVRFVAVFVVLAAASLPVRAESPELGSAKELYAQASYEDALAQLNRINDAEVANQVDQYRALCLLALGREREAQASLERIVVREPLYVVKADDASPKLVTLFQQVRQRTLPAAAKELYAKARASYDARRFAEARPVFEQMLAVLKETTAGDTDSGIADLKQLGEGFLKLTDAELKPAAPPPPASPPPPARPLPVVPRVYTSGDSSVVPPVETLREMPAWNPPYSLEKTTFTGTLQIDIDERGAVERAIIVESIAPGYDGRLLAATRTWKFQPAMKDGIAVKYRKSIAISLRPPGEK
jgi:tetratricopeptide (TPR) repeat protein